MMENILTIRHLKKYYASHKAVDDISFDLESGSIFGLLGPNGAGKTTLLRMITGIFYPDEGEIIFQGKPLGMNDIKDIGYMPEERGLYKKMLVGDQILYLAQLKDMPLAQAKERAKYWIKKFDLQQWWNKKIGDLSKGMQQKVQFISTILHDPKLLILDEPFSGLDPINSNIIKSEIFELSKKGTTIIFSTHRMEQVEEICKHIVLVNQGKKILDGPIRDIKNDFKKHEFILSLAEKPDHLEITGQSAFEVKEIQDHSIVIKLREGHSNNEVLSFFIQNGFIITGFNEILPTINQVFIEQVAKDVPASQQAAVLTNL